MNNGFSLNEALLSLFIVSICAQLILSCVHVLKQQEDLIINEKIEKKWFYTD